MKHPIGNRRKSVYDFIAKTGGATKTQIVEATGLTRDQVRVLLFRACADGEIVHDGKRHGIYTIGTLIERFIPQTKEQVLAKQREYQRRYVARTTRPEVKQTKPWTHPTKTQVNIVYPEGLKVTVCPSVRYEPLNLRAHV